MVRSLALVIGVLVIGVLVIGVLVYWWIGGLVILGGEMGFCQGLVSLVLG